MTSSANYTADRQCSVQTQQHDFTKLSYLKTPLNQINITDNLDSGQVLVTFNRVWLMFTESKLAENETQSAFCPLTKSLFSLQSHSPGWFWSIFVRPRPHKFVKTSSCVRGQLFSLPLALYYLFTSSPDSPDRQNGRFSPSFYYKESACVFPHIHVIHIGHSCWLNSHWGVWDVYDWGGCLWRSPQI